MKTKFWNLILTCNLDGNKVYTKDDSTMVVAKSGFYLYCGTLKRSNLLIRKRRV